MQSELQQLVDRVDRLVDLNRRLNDENRSLRHAQEHLVAERTTLMGKNEQARTRIEAMIGRLKAMEQTT
jgi:cell division protein ZapB